MPKTKKAQTKTTKSTQPAKETKTTKPKTIKKATPTVKKLNRKLLTLLLFIIAIALLGYRFIPWFIPAVVDKKPITRFSLYQRMNQVYGKQTLDDLVNEAILKKAIHDSKVKVSDQDVKTEIDKLEEQFKNLGGLDEALAQRGLSRDDLKDQITTQLSVEKILADQIKPSEEEVQQEFDKNKDTLYKDKKFEEVKDTIVKTLRQTKLNDAFLKWFQEVKNKTQVRYLQQ